MKEYINTPEEGENTVNEPAVAYERIKKVKSPHVKYDINGLPKGYTLDEFSAELDRKLSERYRVDFGKVTRLINSGELSLDDVTDELLNRPEFQYC
jgi:thiamine biosynthesis lipoprotein ApbE